MEDDPITRVCALPEGALLERRAEIQSLLENRTTFTHHRDGLELAWAFSQETARSLLDFIFFERGCCSTFTYELGFAPPQDTITLRLRAEPGQVAALRNLYQSLTQP